MIRKFIFSILFVIGALLAVAQNQVYKRIQIEYTPENFLNILNLGLSPDNMKDGRWLIFEIPESEIKKITGAGIHYEVLIDDLVNFYVERNRGNDPKEITDQYRAMKEYAVPAGFSLGSMGGYCTYSEILQHLDNMAATYPNLITQKQPIGSKLTVEGRPLYWVKISDNPQTNEAEPEILYTGLIHAREPGSMQLLLFYMYYLLENYATNPEIRNLVDNTEMYFVPCVNPDGYIYNQTTNPNGGGQWRKNRKSTSGGYYGIDLNRNFGYQWGYDNYGSSPDPASLTYRGTAGFSEAETQIIRDFCNEHEFSVALNYHTYGEYLLYPWGYAANPPTPDYTYFETIGKVLSSQNNYRYGTPVSILYLVNGEANDWMYGEQTSKPKIISFTPEVGSATDGFWPSMTRIIPQCFETLYQNITAAKLAGQYFLIKELNNFNIKNHNGYFSFEIERLGVGSAPVTVSIEGISNYFAEIGSAKTFQNTERLQKITDSISYRLKPGIIPGERIKFVIKTVSGSFTKSDTITKVFGNAELLLSDDCSNMNYWNSPKWNTTAASYVSPTGSITDSPGTTYNNNETSAITLRNAISLNGAISAGLTFYAKWIMDGGSDYVYCEASINGGQTWTSLSGKYTATLSVQGLPNTPVYIGKQSEWVKEFIDLTPFCGHSILIRFTLKADISLVKDGFYFDDLKIESIDGTLHSEEYQLDAGWNSLSSYLIPTDKRFDMIFRDYQNQVAFVQDNSGNSYQPGNSGNTLTNWDSQKGYSIKMAGSSAFAISGYPETYLQLSLDQGWSLIPVFAQTDVLISEILVSPPGSIEMIKEIAGVNVWWPQMGISSLNSLLPGKSYLVKMKNNAVLIFP